MDPDLILARKLQEEYNREYYGIRQKRSFMDIDDNNDKVALTDPSLEYTDPTPDVHKMFVNFDRKFFWNSLGRVEVMWSSRLTSCAGLCRYRSHNGAITVHLSLPLLKLRPRKDLVETLLHEMIHAYLFVTKNFRDRGAHGPEFQSHMHRINKIAGTHITIYHTFHAEVDAYRTHWWRCNGPCQNRGPFFGFVKRSMNRAPGPNDIWFADHKRNCSGSFIKVKEPSNFKSKMSKTVSSDIKEGNSPSTKVKKIPHFFKKVDSKPNGGNSSVSVGTFTKNTTEAGATIKRIATITSVHQEGESNSREKDFSTKQSIIPFSGKGHTLGKATVSINDKPWLKRFTNNSPSCSGIVKNSNTNIMPVATDSKKLKTGNTSSNYANDKEISCTVACPICNKSVKTSEINDHLDLCVNDDVKDNITCGHRCFVCNELLGKECTVPTLCTICEESASSFYVVDFNNTESVQEDHFISCPMCEKKMDSNSLERHLETCIVDTCNSSSCVPDDEDEDIIVLS